MINVKIILVNSERKILLLHREDKEGIEVPNKWSFVGGGLEEGESPEEGIVRETEEEIGFTPSNISLFKIYEDPGINRHVFVGKIDKTLDDLELTEGDEIRFFNVKEALEMSDLSNNTRRYIQDYFCDK